MMQQANTAKKHSPLGKNTNTLWGSVSAQSGFTMIEIIAVLVILGILAAVAVPKYFDLQGKARDRAMRAALAEAAGRVTMHFGDQILSGVLYDSISYSATSYLGTNLGDFTLSVTSGSGASTNAPILLQVTGKGGTMLSGVTATRSLPRPGRP
jgi:prepilin-type N-terminal cleavage/methylation domain-containing protein